MMLEALNQRSYHELLERRQSVFCAVFCCRILVLGSKVLYTVNVKDVVFVGQFVVLVDVCDNQSE